jgi:hypothetical protein
MSGFSQRLRSGMLVLAVAVSGSLCAGAATALAAGVPVLEVKSPSAVQATSATIHGTVDPGSGAVLFCAFQYGVGYEFSESAECSPAPGGAPTAVSANVTGLQGDTAYAYRLAALVEVEPGVDELFFSASNELLVTPPTVVGDALASGVSSFAATLAGVVDSGELTPSYHFVYGTTSAYGSSAPAPDAQAGTGGFQNVSRTLTGLQPETTYHFALVVSNFGGGVSVGPDETFTTRPLVAAQATTGGVEAVGQNAATLTGAVDPEGLDTTYYFQYGTSPAYGASWPSVPAHAGGGDGGAAVAVGLEGLQPETTYHYRLVASNEDGTTYGADQTFTTAARLVSAVQPTPLSAPSPAVLAAIKESAKRVTVTVRKQPKRASGRRTRRRQGKDHKQHRAKRKPRV